MIGQNIDVMSEFESPLPLPVMVIIVAVGIFAITIIHIIPHYSFKYIPESGIAMILGLIAGVILHWCPSDVTGSFKFDTSIFYSILLPIIVFECGYSVKKRYFFHGPILSLILIMAIFGTLIMVIVCFFLLYPFSTKEDSPINQYELLLFSCSISAVDPVATLGVYDTVKCGATLHHTIFGEAILNDAVVNALILSIEETGEREESRETTESISDNSTLDISSYSIYNATNGQEDAVLTKPSSTTTIHLTGKDIGWLILRFIYSSLGAIAIGMVGACISSLFYKYVTVLQCRPEFEAFTVLLFAFIPYLCSSWCSFPGVMTSLATGIVMSHYTRYNLSQKGRTVLQRLLFLLAHFSELFIVFILGLGLVFTPSSQPVEDGMWNIGFICACIGAVLVSRMVAIAIIIPIVNIFRSKERRISFSMCGALWGALMRGGISYALSLSISDGAESLYSVTTTVVCVFTTVIMGSLTYPMLKLFKIPTGVEWELEYVKQDGIGSVDRGARRLDRDILKPFFVRDSEQMRMERNELANRRIRNITRTRRHTAREAFSRDVPTPLSHSRTSHQHSNGPIDYDGI
ncbi:Cation/H+ exchanger, CPA1 family like protein [Aduncisulcus paluster]|uniref:Cation/H+ exchanger, CPA1 family like protein n=1 Tax=Aduncisulcus paluster TaxID=2918883 RepID=A0ABQ5K9Z0_9EUKA|nr:Cation/H+ exchanger, CPA1 family like protein [Aduncisulcus paluster]